VYLPLEVSTLREATLGRYGAAEKKLGPPSSSGHVLMFPDPRSEAFHT
jgi:hypothetical protein